jgi:hypothetical protein
VKSCLEWLKFFRKENQETARNYQANYQANYKSQNKDSISQQNAQYRSKNKETINLKKREYHSKNKDEINAKLRYQYSINKKEINEKRRRRKPEERIKAFRRDIIHGPNYSCFSCKRSLFKNSVKILKVDSFLIFRTILGILLTD